MFRALGLAAAMAVGAAAVGCAPTLNWREVRPDGSGAQLMFPCKPASHAREVTLAGSAVEMSMYACSVGPATYALAFAELIDPARVTPALTELALAARNNLQAGAAAESSRLRVPGMTPNDQATRWRMTGRLADGRTMQEHAAFFAYGTRVYQATVIGERLDDEALDTFFGALRVGG